jgi:hypothetical protein
MDQTKTMIVPGGAAGGHATPVVQFDCAYLNGHPYKRVPL